MEDLRNKKIVFLSADNLGNQSLVYSIEKEVGIPCSIYAHPLHMFPEHYNFNAESRDASAYNFLFLLDCTDRDIDSATQYCMSNPLVNDNKVAFYNLAAYSEDEIRALSRKVRGFFYVHDKMDIFLKGIQSIFAGEIWISRQILLDYVMNSAGDKLPEPEKNAVELTQREQQILSLVSVGVSNEDISDRLCISLNTVKTHMYNIFKKIDVSNRLQAALWAARHL